MAVNSKSWGPFGNISEYEIQSYANLPWGEFKKEIEKKFGHRYGFSSQMTPYECRVMCGCNRAKNFPRRLVKGIKHV